MDPLSVIALVLSIIAIGLWAYSFLFQNQKLQQPVREKNMGKKEEKEENAMPPQPVSQSPSVPEQFFQRENQFKDETQKFSRMVRKNLEMLNTRVGIKFDVKPISERYSGKSRGPGYIDSMDVSDEERRDMISDSSEEETD